MAPYTERPFCAELREQSVRAKTPGSLKRFTRSAASLAGGVSSSLRRSGRPYPLFFTHGSGAHVYDVDRNSYLDYGLAWGPLILGHAPPEPVAAAATQLGKGVTFGAQHDLEFEVAEQLTQSDSLCRPGMFRQQRDRDRTTRASARSWRRG